MDKRKHPRINVYHLAKYCLPSGSNQTTIITGIKNIGAGGICLQTEEPLPVGSVIQVYINFPKAPKPVPALAKVVWVNHSKKKNCFDVGMNFVDIEQAFSSSIIKSVDAVNKISKK
ncbi:MAG: PilZ domain-containing protein [Candidatus Omnitrophica bacterium]|nr:PilZ domain-containing protein [Candidatus Omnitrophota bacterium]